jgi:hypothetical protein
MLEEKRMIKIHGESDDLIEIEGDIHQEFNIPLDDDESIILAFSDGTLLKIQFDGCWRITRIHAGLATYNKIYEAISPDDDKYSDEVELTGHSISWIALASIYHRIKNKHDSGRYSSTIPNKSNNQKEK